MAFRKLVRESTFQIARRDVAYFLRDHEQELLKIFREELQALDDQLPDEETLIDLRIVPLGEVVVKSALRAITRFLLEDRQDAPDPGKVEIRKSEAEPVHTIGNVSTHR